MRLRRDIEKFCALESHLSESPRSQVPYFCYLLALRRSDSRGVAMRMLPSKRRSSFGPNWVRCGNELIAPQRSEYRDEGQIGHFLALLEMRLFLRSHSACEHQVDKRYYEKDRRYHETTRRSPVAISRVEINCHIFLTSRRLSVAALQISQMGKQIDAIL